MSIHDIVLSKACDFLEEYKRSPRRVFLGVSELRQVLNDFHLLGSVELPTNKYMGMEVTVMPTTSYLEVSL